MNDIKTNLYINNLQSVEKQYSIIQTLGVLWNQDRDTFFKEIALWLEENIGANELTIIFNDIQEKKTEEEKPKLTQSLISKIDEEWSKSNLENSHKELFNTYKLSLSIIPKVLELSSDNLTIGGELRKSPFLICCKFQQYNSMQESMIKGLFLGLDGLLTLK